MSYFLQTGARKFKVLWWGGFAQCPKIQKNVSENFGFSDLVLKNVKDPGDY